MSEDFCTMGSLCAHDRDESFKICQQLCCENKDDAFFQIIVTADEMWMHHYKPEAMCESME
jgi:hypothetical protein